MEGQEFTITFAQNDADIGASFAVMRELRTQYEDPAAYRDQIRRQMDDGYNLALLWFNGEVAGCAGFRVHETLSRGKYMYVEDLVTSAKQRSHGFGDKLFDWLQGQARERGCAQMEIISGVQRGDAHRFYHRKRMTIKAFQLVLPIKAD
ncbi:GCN5 family acetyltransferase [Skermanella stibiiresistens SB22]|uniref:GCN5 family acetyltransferase n=1 Tax=Skermanella stibiiresistens SB22 TaxID=1385369 RepID=W9GYS0_9PROT|nr:GNAT family N-acetyltransferase [Skermanella stibiiresistens]EWY38974.1 GCN5 family acetyltransferase [Skermanella stibiiresistens SB22]